MSLFFAEFLSGQSIIFIPLSSHSSRTYIRHSSFTIHYLLGDPISLFTAHTARLAEVASS